MQIRYIVLILLSFAAGCAKPQAPKTPEEYKYQIIISENDYRLDNEYLRSTITTLVEKKAGPFYPDSYDDKTDIFIDSILYSPDQSRIVFFVIAKNSNANLLKTNDPEGEHFDAMCFLGTKESTNRDWIVRWFRIMNFHTYTTYSDVSAKIRFRYFRNLVEIKNEEGESRYKYNIDDIRFWEGPVWDKETINNPTLYESGDKN